MRNWFYFSDTVNKKIICNYLINAPDRSATPWKREAARTGQLFTVISIKLWPDFFWFFFFYINYKLNPLETFNFGAFRFIIVRGGAPLRCCTTNGSWSNYQLKSICRFGRTDNEFNMTAVVTENIPKVIEKHEPDGISAVGGGMLFGGDGSLVRRFVYRRAIHGLTRPECSPST